MDKLLRYLNALAKAERAVFCEACCTSERYLRKAVSAQQRLGSDLCIKIDKASAGEIRCEDLRPDVDWAYLRDSAKPASGDGDTGV